MARIIGWRLASDVESQCPDAINSKCDQEVIRVSLENGGMCCIQNRSTSRHWRLVSGVRKQPSLRPIPIERVVPRDVARRYSSPNYLARRNTAVPGILTHRANVETSKALGVPELIQFNWYTLPFMFQTPNAIFIVVRNVAVAVDNHGEFRGLRLELESNTTGRFRKHFRPG